MLDGSGVREALKIALALNADADGILKALDAAGYEIVRKGAKPLIDVSDLADLNSDKVGRRIAAVRDERGLSQEEFAAKLDCHPITVSKLERNEMDVSLDWIMRAAKALEVSPAAFLRASEIDDPKGYVLGVLEKHKIAPGALAKAAGITPSTLTRALNDPAHKFTLSTKTLRKIKEWDAKQ